MRSIFRLLKKDFSTFIINLLGLSVGFSAFLILFVWVLHEAGFDRFHDRSDDIYRVISERRLPEKTLYNVRTPGPLGEVLNDRIPEIQYVCRTAWTGERIMRFDNRVFYEDSILTVDPGFFKIFNFEFLKGVPDSALKDLNSIIIDEDIARKYFGNSDPMGKILSLDDKFQFKVTGIIKKVPENSSIQFKMVVPFDVVRKLGWDTERWDFNMATTFLCLKPGTDTGDIETRLTGIIQSNAGTDEIGLKLQPLTAMHLHSNFTEQRVSSRFMYVIIFSLASLFILLMAAFNYINLSIARSENRSKEVGIRIVSGATKKELIKQFLSESILQSTMAMLIAPAIIIAVLPLLNKVSDHQFTIGELFQPAEILTMVIVTLLIGLLSGLYPAFYMSSFSPVKALKRDSGSGMKRATIRKALLAVQVGISVILFISFLIINGQIRYIKTKDLGFEKENVVSIPLGISNADNSQIYRNLKKEVLRYPDIQNVTASFTALTWFASPTKDIVYNGKKLDESIPVAITSVEADFIETMKMKLINGRTFTQDSATNKGTILVNETFARLMGSDKILNETISIGETYKGRVIGVLKDFHIGSVTDEIISPLIIFYNPEVNYIYIKINPANTGDGLKAIETSWNKVAPNLPFQYSFLEDDLNLYYSDLETIQNLMRIFTFIAGFIACIGLFGLTASSIAKRTKEIGIRKILGAQISDLLVTLSKGYIAIVFWASLLTWPLIYYLMHGWLTNFPYRMNLTLWPFLFASMSSIIIAALTISFLTIKSSLANPIDSLRDE